MMVSNMIYFSDLEKAKKAQVPSLGLLSRFGKKTSCSRSPEAGLFLSTECFAGLTDCLKKEKKK